MNETNIKHGYSLMVCDARAAILNPGAQISLRLPNAKFFCYFLYDEIVIFFSKIYAITFRGKRVTG